MISKRIQQMQPSPTVSLGVRVKELKRQGENIIDLAVGEPDFATPDHIKHAAKKAIDEDRTHYTSTAGIIELREAIAQKLAKENDITVTIDQIIISAGSKLSIYLALHTLCDKEDEVIVAVPTWVTYVEQVKLAGGKPVLIELQPPFILTAADIERNITKKTKMIILNSPANPTGALIPRLELQKIADLVVKHNLWIISDEIYEKIIYDTEFCSIASLNKEIGQRTITINGFSKAFAMTGWRLSYAAGDKQIIQAMTDLQGQIISNAPSIAQYAGVEALTKTKNEVEDMKKAFHKRRDFLLKEFSQIPELSVTKPEGAFYLFIKINENPYRSSTEWCEKLLEKEYVAVVPGEGFLYPGYFRLSYAAPLGDLEEGVKRIKRFIKGKG